MISDESVRCMSPAELDALQADVSRELVRLQREHKEMHQGRFGRDKVITF